MTLSRYLLSWAPIFLVLLATFGALQQWGSCQFDALRTFFIVLIGFLVLLSVQIYFVGSILSRNEKPGPFNGLIVITIFFRLFGLGAIFFIFRSTLQENLLCTLVPSGLSYLLFSIQENWILAKLGHAKK